MSSPIAHPRRSPRQERSRLMVSRILDAGRTVLIQHGYDGTTTNLIAKEADISPGSLYQYFPNKDVIIAAIVDDRLRLAHARLAAIDGLIVHETIASAPAFLTFTPPAPIAVGLVDTLRQAGIAIATVGLDYARWELRARGLSEVLRVAPHAYTSAEDIERFAGIVAAEVTG